MTQILGEAEVTAAKLLAEADFRADRVGRDDLVNLRVSLKERIEAMRVARARLSKLGEETGPRLREAAAQLAEMPARLAEVVRDPVGDASLDHAFVAGGPVGDSTPSHLMALMKAADTIAEDLAKTARKEARELEHAARREADRIAAKEPKLAAQAYDPTARSAGALHREVKALSGLLSADEDVGEGAQVKERREGWNRVG